MTLKDLIQVRENTIAIFPLNQQDIVLGKYALIIMKILQKINNMCGQNFEFLNVTEYCNYKYKWA